jgi:cell wall-associated NlpC family hydrolase
VKEQNNTMKKLFTLVLATSLFYIMPVKPAEAQYYVQNGDTMAKIAQSHKMSLKALLALNKHIKNPSLIYKGDYIVTVEPAETAKTLTDYAKSLQDVTAYQYGGNNFPYQVDCSSWVQGIYGKFGVKLPRTSREQAKTGVPVTYEDLQEGDLMFFSTKADKTITHVGIKLADTYWISNLNSKSGVKILSTWGKWSREYFMWGTRYKL